MLQYISERKKEFPHITPGLRLALLGIAVIEFAKICFELINSSDLYTVFPGVLTLGLGLFYYLRGGQQVQNKAMLFLGLIHLLGVLSLYRIAFASGSLAVSLAWGAYSLVILAVGYQRKDSALVKSSLIVLMVTSLKALIYDSSQAPSLIRIGSLLVTGVLLYGAGLIFQKVRTWEK